MSEDRHLRINKPKVSVETVDGQGVVVHTGSGTYYHLNKTARVLVAAMEEGACASDLAAALAESTATSVEDVRDDVDKLIEQLAAEDLVVPADAAPGAARVRFEGDYVAPQMQPYRLNPQDRFEIRTSDIAGKVIDDEAIIINIGTGAYYSMDNVGAAVWQLIEAGCTIQHIINAVSEAWDVSPRRVHADLERLAEQLAAERVANVVGCMPPDPPGPLETPQREYEPPELNVYRDMEDLLALDPPMPLPEDTSAPKQREPSIGDVEWNPPQ